MTDKHLVDEMVEQIAASFDEDKELSDSVKSKVLRNISALKNTQVNILITGATGCGKSSTINALFNADKAKVGQGVDPETMDIQRFEFSNIILFDSPGLGDGKEADEKHSKAIIDKLYEKDGDGNLLIDLVLVILDGASRDLGTSFELINKVIVPNLGDDKKRLLVAINQADMAMKGKNWDEDKNQPNSTLLKFLDDKVVSTQNRIKEATGIDVQPIYYAAGYKEGDEEQNPWNLSKLLYSILLATKKEKRIVIAQDINKSAEMWQDDDGLENYRAKIQETFLESIENAASSGADIGEDLGDKIGGAIGRALFGKTGEEIGDAVGGFVGKVVGGALGGAVGFVKGGLGKLMSLFS